jgi:NhaP-type Na+/H+ or K+/H+ antiporter
MTVLFPSLSFISCMVIAACLTPTDPVISAAIVGKCYPIYGAIEWMSVDEMSYCRVVGNGKYAIEHVPDHLRHIISAESAANDGLAYPFLSISIYLTIEATKGEAFKNWLLVGCLCKFFRLDPMYPGVGLPDRLQTKWSLAPCSAQ